MRMRAIAVACVVLSACAGRSSGSTVGTPFASEKAASAQAHAPDLFLRAEQARDASSEAERRGNIAEAKDRQTEARLWLEAAEEEAARIEAHERRVALEREADELGMQLSRDREAAARVAEELSLHEARRVAGREGARLLALDESNGEPPGAAHALLQRAKLQLTLARALGATESRLRPLESRLDPAAQRKTTSVAFAQDLLQDIDALLGALRSRYEAPLAGQTLALQEAAAAAGFESTATEAGMVVQSDRVFLRSGGVARAQVKRMTALWRAFPHGPVVCQVAVPALGMKHWVSQVASLREAIARQVALWSRNDSGAVRQEVPPVGVVAPEVRVSVQEIETTLLAPGVVRCTLPAYHAL